VRRPNISVEAFIAAFFERHVDMDYNRVVRFRGEDGAATIKDLRNRLIIENYSIGLDFPNTVLFAGLDAHLRRHDEAVIAQTQTDLAYDGSGDGSLRTWLEAVTGKVDDHDLRVMKHFIWQVKRKLAGHLVTYHMMPVIYGKSGAGKSVAVDALLKPLKRITAKRDFTVFEDDRKWSVFHRYFVIVFDEMAKAARTDVNSMKSIISSDDVSYRLLATHEEAVGRNVATFIGTSNDPISDIVLDPTSARRFWQITSQPLVDWKAVNAINALSIWRSVDEAQENAPIKDTWEDVARVQSSSFRHKTPVEIWFDQHCDVDATSELRASFLYGKFKDWSEKNRLGGLISSIKFSKDLQTIDDVKKRIDKKGTLYNVRWTDTAKDERVAGDVIVLDPMAKVKAAKND
jgi:hypothetical protein